ncbi:mini-circle protein [Pseudoclavibacter sp. RFBI5]|uniref:DinB family protein n=1 Tax=Pseudoclavibacter sp. RFBI5 TaxID=2080578 RepID=UPI000CE82619|nr:DinB family protein [Pseudoclavibacter sp. RFBI5]PPG03240.1 mini-circle protein [Pseudoclavibacter sp. RFBI5]
MTTIFDAQDRPEPPLGEDEWSTLNGFLDFHRATLAWKLSGLGSAELSRTLPPSSMTLGGLVKHLTYVEDDWFGVVLFGEEQREPWASVDWTKTPDWEWDAAGAQEPAELLAEWEASVARARAAAERAFRAGGLAYPAAKGFSDGRIPRLRWILIHMVEEYSRHNGHADLLREAIDGSVGE